MKFFIGANLKMNKNYSELIKYNSELEKIFNKTGNIELTIFPNFTGLSIFSKNKNISLGAQNMSVEKEGAFTGEISLKMLLDLNCIYVILGHSEIRSNLLESSELINKKAKLALKNNIVPIICISKKEEFLESIKDLEDKELIIAYEPISSIGTGKTDNLENIFDKINYIKNNLKNKNSRVIYGGSVNSSNSKKISQIKNLDGFLIGGASLKVDNLLDIIGTI